MRRLGCTAYYALMVLYKYSKVTFDFIYYSFLKDIVTKKSLHLFLQRYPNLVTKEKDGRFNLYSLTSEGREYFEKIYLQKNSINVEEELERLRDMQRRKIARYLSSEGRRWLGLPRDMQFEGEEEVKEEVPRDMKERIKYYRRQEREFRKQFWELLYRG